LSLVSYVLLTITIFLLIFFSFYKYDFNNKIDDGQKLVYYLILISFFISLLFFLFSERWFLKHFSKDSESIKERENTKAKIIEYSRFYNQSRNDIIYVEEGNLKEDIDYYNIIKLPVKNSDCKVKLLNKECYFKDSDLFKKDGSFSEKKFIGSQYDRKYKNKTLKQIFDKVFEDIIYHIRNGNIIAFPEGKIDVPKAPLISKYINNYKNYLLVLSETYDQDLPQYFNSKVLLTPEAIHHLNPDFDSIREENNQERKATLISLAAKNSKMDECDFISSIVGKRKDKADSQLEKYMLTLVKDKNCHDEKKEELAKDLSVKFKSPLEARLKVRQLSSIYRKT
jgi:hypothetical protein